MEWLQENKAWIFSCVTLLALIVECVRRFLGHRKVHAPSQHVTGSQNIQAGRDVISIHPASVAPSAPEFALSESARDLLLEAVQDSNGAIMRVRTHGEGLDVQTNRRHFVESGNIRSEATWQRVVDELHNRGLVEDRAGRGELFFVTDAGYQAGDLLRGG
jgi:hypothetical protein